MTITAMLKNDALANQMLSRLFSMVDQNLMAKILLV